MNPKHFNFDLYYFPLQASNIFQSIKIQQKNKNNKLNKNGGYGIKRFSFKNQLNFQQIPQLFPFDRTNKKTKEQYYFNNITPTSNQTINESSPEKSWSPQIKTDEQQQKIQNCPQMAFSINNKQNYPHSQSNSKLKFNSSIVKQNSGINCKIQSKIQIFDKNVKRKVEELDCLQQCSSQLSQSSKNISIPEKKIMINAKSVKNVFESKKKRNNYTDKNVKKRKTQKSLSPRKSNNPQNQGNKLRNRQTSISSVYKQKNIQKEWNSLLIQENNKKTQKKFISLNKKQYYIIPNKNKKNRSLNKQKKIRIKSNKDCNVILSNGVSPKYSSHPSNGFRNSSLSSTIYQKSKYGPQKLQKLKKIIIPSNNNKQLKITKSQTPMKAQLQEIIKKTGQVLDKYKGECTQLRKQKLEYQIKYKEVIKKLNRIKEELQIQLQIK